MPPAQSRVCNVSTKCASVDEFVSAFAPFVDEQTVFIPARVGVSVGQVLRFQITLRDGSLVYGGSGEVAEVHKEPTGPLGKAGVRVRVTEVDPDARSVRYRLLARRRALAAPIAKRPEPPRPTKTLHAFGPATPASPDAKPAATDEMARGKTLAAPLSAIASARPGAMPSALPRDEQRTPGSPYKLPANPLSDMSTNALEFFVEAQLTEDVNAPDPTPGSLADMAEEKPALPALPAPVPQVDALMPESVSQSLLEPEEDEPPPPPPPDSPLFVLTAGPWERFRARLNAAFEPLLARLGPRRAGIERGVRRFGPLTGAAIVGMIIGFAFWGDGPDRPPAPTEPDIQAVPLAETPPAAAPEPTPAPAAPVAPAPAQPQPETAAADRPATPANCAVRIDSKPRGATVRFGARTLGRTPLSRAVLPCGEVSLSFAHPRYRTTTETVNADPDAPSAFNVRLTRPPAELALSSAPAGATFKVNGVTVGRAPRRVNVLRFESVRIEASLPGQRPWRQTIYVRQPATKVHATFAAGAAKKSR